MTVNDVFEKAKGVILKFGDHPPFLLVDGTRDEVAIPLLGLPGMNTQERVSFLHNYGTQMAGERPVGQLQKVFLVHQAWASKFKGDKIPTLRAASQDPHRQEVLLIVELDVLTNKQQSVAFELVRDNAGQLTLIQPFMEMEDGNVFPAKVYSPLLPAFVQGYSIISN